jgi:hypothetical protein
MKFYVYVLENPEHSQDVYYGSTSQPPKKRLSDHIAESKFKAKNGMKMTPKMEWIAYLLKNKVRPTLRVLSEHDTEEAATLAENQLIQDHPEALNCCAAARGRPLGSLDSPKTIQKKREAARLRYESLENWDNQRSFDPSFIVSQLYRAGRRMELGFPDPHIGARNSLDNRRHFKKLQQEDPDFHIEPVWKYKERFCHA